MMRAAVPTERLVCIDPPRRKAEFLGILKKTRRSRLAASASFIRVGVPYARMTRAPPVSRGRLAALQALHGFERLGDVVRRRHVADGGGHLAVRRDDEGRALG